MKSIKSDTRFNFYNGEVFWDYDSEWNDEICQYPDCGLPAVGRIKSEKTYEKYPPMGYMLVCDQHLKEFIEKYNL